MTPFVESGLIDATHIDDNTLDMGTLNGQLVGIPIGINARTFIYDPEMFEKSGAKLPEFGWTWEDADEAARKIAEHYPYGIDNLETHRSAEVWIRQHGGRYFNDDGTGLGYDDDKIMENYFAMKLKWMQDGIAPTLNVVAEHNTQENSLIALGQVAMTSTWSNMIGNLSKVAQEKAFEHGALPGPKRDKSVSGPTMLWSIPKTSQNKEEAAKFISFFINNLEANKILNADRGVPVNNEVMMEMMDFVDESTVKMFEYIQHLAANTAARSTKTIR